MAENGKNGMSAADKRRHSLTARTVRATLGSCILLGLVALIIGLGCYSVGLTRQYIRHAFNIATYAQMSAGHGTDSRGLAKQVMDIYEGLSEEDRQKVGTEEYRQFFSEVDMSKGSVWDILVNMLSTYTESEDVYDVYLGMYDERTGALVYIADPDERERMYPGDWEEVAGREVKTFLNWDGEGMLYDIDRTEKYGWMCTAGLPIRSKEDGSIVVFALADVTIDNVLRGMWLFAAQLGVALLAVTAFIAWRLTRRMKKTLVAPINAIADAAVRYVQDRRAGVADTDHFASLHIRTQDEVENLSRIMADMERDLASYEEHITRITAEKERIGAELSLATRIQASMLPHVFPPFPDRKEFDIYASMDPAREVGGDFYDFFLIDEDHLGLLMADVSGKGVPAALFMMASKIILQSCAMLGRSAAEILTKTNEAVCSNNQAGMFVTVWIGILEISTGKLTAANAGHEYPVLQRNGGRFEILKDKHGFVIGGMAGVRYREYELQLEPGDKIFVYTDGVPEATDCTNQLFGSERMLAALNQAPGASPEGVLKNVRRAVDGFVGDAEQFDDLTMLCMEYRGKAV